MFTLFIDIGKIKFLVFKEKVGYSFNSLCLYQHLLTLFNENKSSFKQ